MSKIAMDFDIYHRRRWPGRPMSFASCAWLVASSPGLRLLMMHRIDHWFYLLRKAGGWRKWIWRITFIPLEPLKYAVRINAKSQINNDIDIDGGVFFSDSGYILYGARKTGVGTVVGMRVTAGIKRANNGYPVIGSNVWIGSDCVIYGNISIGDGATLLPNTVLSKSIPCNTVMEGNPARRILNNFDNFELRERHDMDAMQYVNSKQEG